MSSARCSSRTTSSPFVEDRHAPVAPEPLGVAAVGSPDVVALQGDAVRAAVVPSPFQRAPEAVRPARLWVVGVRRQDVGQRAPDARRERRPGALQVGPVGVDHDEVGGQEDERRRGQVEDPAVVGVGQIGAHVRRSARTRCAVAPGVQAGGARRGRRARCGRRNPGDGASAWSPFSGRLPVGEGRRQALACVGLIRVIAVRRRRGAQMTTIASPVTPAPSRPGGGGAGAQPPASRARTASIVSASAGVLSGR